MNASKQTVISVNNLFFLQLCSISKKSTVAYMSYNIMEVFYNLKGYVFYGQISPKSNSLTLNTISMRVKNVNMVVDHQKIYCNTVLYSN